QRKTVASLRSRAPKPHMLDFVDPAALPAMLERPFAPTEQLRAAIAAYADDIHPYRDGRSSERVIEAVEDLLAGKPGKLARKPLAGWWRGVQLRKELGYCGPGAR